MLPENDRRVVGALAHIVVTDGAPGELPAFRVMRDEYFRRGIRLDRKGRDTLLGIGVETAVALLSPVALEVCRRLWDTLCAEAAGAMVRAGRARAEELLNGLRARFGTDTGEDPTVTFSPEHLREVHRRILQQAGAMGLPEEQQWLMANAVVGALQGPQDTTAAPDAPTAQEATPAPNHADQEGAPEGPCQPLADEETTGDAA
ncbi:hypothetical protein ACWERY_06095 [Streptomyces sp. NPDC004082]|uniref:hypothetical protein n=1 Tax=unclassified Streptomyces TaxID=2593676 RepID=UPI0033A362E8